MRPSRLLRLTPVFLVVLAACSSVATKSEKEDPASFVRSFCEQSGAAREVTGSVWMKAKSKEASGQFPATVQARFPQGAPHELRLEITQLLGARAALIEIRGNEFKIEAPRQTAVNRKATSWGGIPLEWASQLFMDRFPCPQSKDFDQLRWRWTAEDELEGRPASGDVIWRFKFRKWNLKPWVEFVFWQKAAGKVLEVRRDDPEPNEGWARRWEVSSPMGQVKVRWKERKSI